MYAYLIDSFIKYIVLIASHKLENEKTKQSSNDTKLNIVIDEKGIKNMSIEMLFRYLVSISVGFITTLISFTFSIVFSIIIAIVNVNLNGKVSLSETVIIFDATINLFCIYFLFDFEKPKWISFDKLCNLCNKCCKTKLIKQLIKANSTYSQQDMKQQFDTLL